ncbi:hypothetical protein [Desertibacillus haloalkaliphilus]|uniref:hypothetical protein n=1 Tax=Desertibacillus haloalkaliphilus TaxID=1328930 RepID=UPI001C266D27|nr:hypothetical protein [Desertibacillus haloalkaliphilus]MBU8907515.1 hypothetical protein [Desertibacillus haloalkaliphilus]
MKRKFMQMTFLVLIVFLLSACGRTETFQHIEVFVTETSEQNDEGYYETTGFKKVNVITTIEEGNNHIATDIKAIEDFYDLDGRYIKTEIIHSEFNRSKVTNVEDGDERKEELQEPSTILLPDETVDHFQLENMTEEEEEKVKNHVLSFMNKL